MGAAVKTSPGSSANELRFHRSLPHFESVALDRFEAVDPLGDECDVEVEKCRAEDEQGRQNGNLIDAWVPCGREWFGYHLDRKRCSRRSMPGETAHGGLLCPLLLKRKTVQKWERLFSICLNFFKPAEITVICTGNSEAARLARRGRSAQNARAEARLHSAERGRDEELFECLGICRCDGLRLCLVR